MRYLVIFALAALVAVLDQWTKWLVDLYIQPLEVIAVTGFFNLVNIRNYGAAFGFLSDPETTWQTWLFIGATFLASLVILGVAKGAKAKDHLLFTALGLILGGAVGNCIDRIRWRGVVDFLDFHLAGWHWPAFNVADTAICCGALMAACLILFPGTGIQQRKL